MKLSLPPRRIRRTAYGWATFLFSIILVTAMLLGPPISFVIQDRSNQILLERGVLAPFVLVESRPAHDGLGEHIHYAFETENGTKNASRLQSLQTTVSDQDFAAFADPKKRLVLYDPANPKNAVPTPSRLALADKRKIGRRFAAWFYPSASVVILLFLSRILRELKRKSRLLKLGLATKPSATKFLKSRLGRNCIRFWFVDSEGRNLERCQSLNFRIGIGKDFDLLVKDAVVFYDQKDSRICELWLPELAVFIFLDS